MVPILSNKETTTNQGNKKKKTTKKTSNLISQVDYKYNSITYFCDQKVAVHVQIQDLAGAAICNMVCDGKCVGVRFPVRLISSRTETPHPLHLPVSLECCELLFPVHSVRLTVLLRAVAQHSPRIQHQHGFGPTRSHRRAALQFTELEIQGC